MLSSFNPPTIAHLAMVEYLLKIPIKKFDCPHEIYTTGKAFPSASNNVEIDVWEWRE